MKHGLIISAWWAATPDRNMTRITKTTKKDLCQRAEQLVSLGAQTEYLLHGLHSSCAAGGKEKKKKKTQVQRSCRLANWNKALRHSQNIQFYTCFISELSWWNETATRFVLPAVRRQKVKQRSRKKEARRRMCFQSLVMVTNQNSLSFTKRATPTAFICSYLFCL